MMDDAMKVRLEAAGFRETNVQELFGLSREEVELVETRLALCRLIKRLRTERGASQQAAARAIGSDQGNVSKAERNDATVSLEWMIRAAFALGASRQDVAHAIAG